MRALLRNPWLFRGALIAYVLCVFGLIGAYFAVSSAEIEISTYIQASSTLQSGRPNAARGIVMNAPTGRLLVGADTAFSIAGKALGEAETEPHGHLHATLVPRDEHQGKQTLSVTVDHRQIEEFEASTSVEVVAPKRDFAWPESTSRLEEGKKPASERQETWTGPLTVEVVPTNRELIRGLPNVFYLRVVEAESGRPVRARIEVQKVEGIFEGSAPVELTSDPLGLVRLELTPSTSLRWTVKVFEMPGPETEDVRVGEGSFSVLTVPAQFALRMSEPMAIVGEPTDGIVQSLHRSGGLMVDLYDPDDWVYAAAYGLSPAGSGVRVIVPESPSSPLYRVQVYRDIFGPEKAWDVQYIVPVARADEEHCREALTRVLSLLAERDALSGAWARAVLDGGAIDATTSFRTCRGWLEAALMMIPRSFVPAPILINSQQDDRRELEAWREEIQADLLVLTSLVLLLGFAVVLFLVLQGVQRAQRQARLLQELDLELEPLEGEPVVRGFDVERALVAMRAAIIIVSILTFGLSLLMLLSWL